MPPLLRAEYRLALARGPALPLLVALANLALISWIIPRLPAPVLDFLRHAFHVQTMADLVLLNDYIAIYLLLYLPGAFALTRVFVRPAEEHELDLYLTKPVTRRHYVIARTVPTLTLTGASGVVLALVTAAKVTVLHPPADALAVFTAVVTLTALVLALLALLNVVYLHLGEVDNALLVASALGLAPLIPGALFLYRPDLLTDPLAAALLVLPANLLWAPAWMPTIALASVTLAAAAITGLLHLAARRLEQHPRL
ncbi:hypothetical protein [Chondromyces apiculatus]|uniref:Uncharacterized protein n=1 Tax=Chondromyces apiculatus DSM 436 TaxID=1192034 RepID=A0A017T644_9BACT|nr:hypothetical protein [Chondromyces apiculatus]EYF04738.1 Hypothetical protein CAP_4214 [Chondromyces apiculatus DSM 436]